MPIIELDGGAAFTAIDFETTGSVPGWPIEPWQIGLCRFMVGTAPASATPTEKLRQVRAPNPTGVLRPVEVRGVSPRTFSSLLRVPASRPFNRFAPGRHALIRDELAKAPSLPEIWDEVSPWLKDRILVAHNIGTERTILRKAAPLSRLGPWIDTLPLARRLLPGRASYALEDLVPDLGLQETVAALAPPGACPHDALYDAIACAVLLRFFAASGLTCVEAR